MSLEKEIVSLTEDLETARNLAEYWRSEACFGDLSCLGPDDAFPWEHEGIYT